MGSSGINDALLNDAAQWIINEYYTTGEPYSNLFKEVAKKDKLIAFSVDLFRFHEIGYKTRPFIDSMLQTQQQRNEGTVQHVGSERLVYWKKLIKVNPFFGMAWDRTSDSLYKVVFVFTNKKTISLRLETEKGLQRNLMRDVAVLEREIETEEAEFVERRSRLDAKKMLIQRENVKVELATLNKDQLRSLASNVGK